MFVKENSHKKITITHFDKLNSVMIASSYLQNTSSEPTQDVVQVNYYVCNAAINIDAWMLFFLFHLANSMLIEAFF